MQVLGHAGATQNGQYQDIVLVDYLGDKIIEKLEESQDSGYFWQEGGTCDWDKAHGGTLFFS